MTGMQSWICDGCVVVQKILQELHLVGVDDIQVENVVQYIDMHTNYAVTRLAMAYKMQTGSLFGVQFIDIDEHGIPAWHRLTEPEAVLSKLEQVLTKNPSLLRFSRN